MSYYLAICDSHRQYVSKLAEYFNFKKTVPFQILAFNDVQKLMEYPGQIELLLVSEELYEVCSGRPGTQHIIVLSESGIERFAGRHFVYKYQPAGRIMREVFRIYGEIGDPSMLTMGGRSIEMIGVYSPVKRCLQTSFALTLGQMIGAKKKCLYLNFEPFSGFSQLMQKKQEQDFMDLMYFLGSSIETFVYKLQGMVESLGDLDYIPPALSFMDFAQIGGEQVRRLLEQIALRTDYEVVILDLSDNLSFLFELLMSCDRIYTITRDDSLAQAKLEQYRQLLAYTQKEEILSHTRFVSFPLFENIPASWEELPHSMLAEYIRAEIWEEKDEG
ncbi:MAG: hypothetical protein J6P60_06780 [Lachnospiraceae bacterium]|nr:hypothetical protein [Lachnospiraceae bacterium]